MNDDQHRWCGLRPDDDDDSLAWGFTKENRNI